MRAFIAISLPADIKKSIKEFQANLKKEEAIEGSWTKDFHLTLKFLGEISEEQKNKVSEILKRVSSETRKFQLDISGIGAFPSENFIKVLWIGFEENKELLALQKKIESSLEKFGLKKEKRFSSHLTLCRVKKVFDGEKLKKIFSEYKNRKFGSFEVSEILLMKSALTEEGAVYEVLEKFCLQ